MSYSIGSSIVMMLRVLSLRCSSAVYNEVVFPLPVEQTQYHAFAMAGRDGRDAHVDGAARNAQADTTVLRQALLGDVELRHDLDARDHQRRDPALLGLQHLAQDAIDPEAHHQPVLERLDMDVGGV